MITGMILSGSYGRCSGSTLNMVVAVVLVVVVEVVDVVAVAVTPVLADSKSQVLFGKPLKGNRDFSGVTLMSVRGKYLTKTKDAFCVHNQHWPKFQRGPLLCYRLS
jgi:hypothetical protein